MQEHIRRAHPEHYISKLPATEESFALMINTPPSERPREPTNQNHGNAGQWPSLEMTIQSLADDSKFTDMREMHSTARS